MALKIDITDGKGVKTRYHVIRSFKYEQDNGISIEVYGYVNQATRDAEKKAVLQNENARAYDLNLDSIRQQLDEASKTYQLDQENIEARDKAVELTENINSLALDPNRPTFVLTPETHYSVETIGIPYFEPITLEGLYSKLATEGKYVGAESI